MSRSAAIRANRNPAKGLCISLAARSRSLLCNGSRSFPLKSSDYFPSSFSLSWPVISRPDGRGRIWSALRAVVALNHPRPPLRSFTGEMSRWSKSENPRANEDPGVLSPPISPEPAPSPRPWASARARPLTEDRCGQLTAAPRRWHPAKASRRRWLRGAARPAATPSWLACSPCAGSLWWPDRALAARFR